MIINLCGFGWSGSGAFIDLLKEYDEITLPTDEDWEFAFIWAPDGLYDLEYKLCKKHCRIFDSDLAIKRFLHIAKGFGDKNGIFHYDEVLDTPFYVQCKSYIDKLVQFEVNANCFTHKLNPEKGDKIKSLYNNILSRVLLNGFTEKLLGWKWFEKLSIDNKKKMLISYAPENFIDVTKEFVASIISQIRKEDGKILLLNQSLPPDMPQLFDHYFSEEHKTIVVRRDPRDNFIAIREMRGLSKPVPDNVKDYIIFYKKTIGESIIKDNDLILSLNFEDLIYDYDNTVKKIESFVGVKNCVRKKQFFQPERSINNTQLINVFPQYKEDIALIEKELCDYLYPFENYEYKRNSNDIF